MKSALAAALLSLILCSAVCALSARSYFVCDTITSRRAAGPDRSSLVRVVSNLGSLSARYTTDVFPPGRGVPRAVAPHKLEYAWLAAGDLRWDGLWTFRWERIVRPVVHHPPADQAEPDQRIARLCVLPDRVRAAAFAALPAAWVRFGRRIGTRPGGRYRGFDLGMPALAYRNGSSRSAREVRREGYAPRAPRCQGRQDK